MQFLLFLSGFLGSGKTTALRDLALKLQEHNLPVHAILNDYRNANIDANLVEDVVSNFTSISGSCVCCESRDELFDAFTQIPRETPSVVLVELNGGADTAEVLELFALDSRCTHLASPFVLATIHSKRWQKRLFHRALERDQFRVASGYLLSHKESVSEQRTTEVRRQLGRINPSARRFDIDSLAQKIAVEAKQIAQQKNRTPAQIHSKNGEKRPHSHPFTSVEFELPKQLDKPALEQFLTELPETILRAKAVVQCANSPTAEVVQLTDESTPQWFAINIAEPWQSSLVLIGQDLNQQELQELLARKLESCHE